MSGKESDIIFTLRFAGKHLHERFTRDDWINATRIAAPYGKLPLEWLTLDDTVKYAGAIHFVIKKKLGKNYKLKKKWYYRQDTDADGTVWMHPLLVTAFLRWLDPFVAVWADMAENHFLSYLRELKEEGGCPSRRVIGISFSADFGEEQDPPGPLCLTTTPIEK